MDLYVAIFFSEIIAYNLKRKMSNMLHFMLWNSQPFTVKRTSAGLQMMLSLRVVDAPNSSVVIRGTSTCWTSGLTGTSLNWGKRKAKFCTEGEITLCTSERATEWKVALQEGSRSPGGHVSQVCDRPTASAALGKANKSGELILPLLLSSSGGVYRVLCPVLGFLVQET